MPRTRSCGNSIPSERQNRDVQAPAAQSTVDVLIVPCSVTTAETLPADDSIPRTAQAVRMAAPSRAGGASQCGRRLVRFRAAVTCGVKGAAPAGRRAANQALQFLAVDQPRPDFVVLCGLDPCRIPLELPVVFDRIDDALFAKSDILADRIAQLPPDAQRLDDHRQLACIPALLPYPTPVAAGLLAGDVALLADDHINALPGQEPGGGDADDAATDDDDIGGIGNGGRRFQRA